MIQSFPPVAAENAQVLVLGSMPGVLSLQKQQYYAHPRNSFWKIMGMLFGAEPELDYPSRISRLTAAQVALWDVLQSCEREGSLDSAIQAQTVVVNDFLVFLKQFPDIHHIFFNGQKAGAVYARHVLPMIKPEFPDICYTPLPSTSPAYASMSFAEKLSAWTAVKDSVSGL